MFAAAATEGLDGRNLLAHQFGAALTDGAVLLPVAFVVVAALIDRPGGTAPRPAAAVPVATPS
jgi:hypothetical protein